MLENGKCEAHKICITFINKQPFSFNKFCCFLIYIQYRVLYNIAFIINISLSTLMYKLLDYIIYVCLTIYILHVPRSIYTYTHKT